MTIKAWVVRGDQGGGIPGQESNKLFYEDLAYLKPDPVTRVHWLEAPLKESWGKNQVRKHGQNLDGEKIKIKQAFEAVIRHFKLGLCYCGIYTTASTIPLMSAC